MKFIGIDKTYQGKFISGYNITYKTELGNTKVYEMISRDKEMVTYDDLTKDRVDAVVLIMHSPDHSKILLNKEFRLAVGKSVFNFPAGLIDPGESVETSAKRELWEETGLSLIKIESVLPKSYSAVGVTNETSVVAIGIAEGEFAPSTSDEEEIEAAWYTKEEVKKLLEMELFASRTQAYCYMWANS